MASSQTKENEEVEGFFPPVSLDVPDDIGVLSYVMAAGRETVEALIHSRSSTLSSGVAFVKPFLGDIFPLVAAAVLEQYNTPSSSSSSSSLSSSGLASEDGKGAGEGRGASQGTTSTTTTPTNPADKLKASLQTHYTKRILGDLEKGRTSQRRKVCARIGCKHGSNPSSSTTTSTSSSSSSNKTPSTSTTTELSFCSRCKSVAYCSRECQQVDWSGHRKECKSFAMLEENNEVFRAAVRVVQSHHYELSATAVHWLLTRGPGAVCVSCENWAAFIPPPQSAAAAAAAEGGGGGTESGAGSTATTKPAAPAAKVMWNNGQRPASHILRVTFIPIMDLDPSRRSQERPFLKVWDANPQGLEDVRSIAVHELATTGYFILYDDEGHMFSLQLPLIPNALEVQAVLGLSGSSSSSFHPEDIHAFSQTDMLIIDLDRPSECEYVYPPLLVPSNSNSASTTSSSSSPFTSPPATRIALDFHSWKMFQTVVANTTNDTKTNETVKVPLEGLPAKEIIAHATSLLSGADSQDDAGIAQHLGLPALVPIPQQQTNESSTTATDTTFRKNNSLTGGRLLEAQLKADHGDDSNKNKNNSTDALNSMSTMGGDLSAEKIQSLKTEGLVALQEARSSSSSEVAVKLAVMDFLPSGFEHSTGIVLGEKEAGDRLASLRPSNGSGGTSSSSSDEHGQKKGAGSSIKAATETVSTATAATQPFDPRAYQICVCPGWGALARERALLYRTGVDCVAGVAVAADNQQEVFTVPATYNMYGTMVVQ